MARSVRSVPGWTQVGKTPGGSTIWRDPKGNTQSRRGFENAYAKESIGLKNWNAKQAFDKAVNAGKSTQQGRNFNRMAAIEARQTGQKWADVKKSEQFRKEYAKTFFRKDGTPKDPSRISRKEGGPLARFLEQMGLEYEGDDWAAGYLSED